MSYGSVKCHSEVSRGSVKCHSEVSHGSVKCHSEGAHFLEPLLRRICVDFGRIWLDLCGFGRILVDLGGFGAQRGTFLQAPTSPDFHTMYRRTFLKIASSASGASPRI